MSDQRTVRVRIGGFTDVGPKRPDNQDAIMANGVIGVGRQAWLALEGALEAKMSLAVVDGMGGYAGGADAAAITGHSWLQGICPITPKAQMSCSSAWMWAFRPRVALGRRPKWDRLPQ